jgi:hypothetical protein
MTSANRPPRGGAPGQPWTPGAAPKGVSCPACGLANEPGARTCRNCGLPIASADDPVRGVAPGRVDLPKVRRSGISALLSVVVVVALLAVGSSLALTGGGGILSGGGRFFTAEASPTPTPAPAVQVTTDPGEAEGTGATNELDQPQIAAQGTKFDYTCDDGAIKDLSKGRWFLSDVVGRLVTQEDGTQFDQVFWKLSRTSDKKAKNQSTVTMQWTTPKELQDRFGIGRVQGNRALLITFKGPVDIAANQIITTDQFEDEGIDQVRKVQMFKARGHVRTAIGLKEDSCARLRASGWGDKKKPPKVARVMLDIERVYESP